MKIHDFPAIAEANRLAFRYTLLSLACVVVTLLEIKLLNVGTIWQLVGIVGASAFMLAAHRAYSAPRRNVGASAFMLAAHRAYSAPRRNEDRRIREAIHADNGTFVDPL